MNSFYINNLIRMLEKIPGVNLLQVAHFGDQHVLMFPKVGTRTIRNSLLNYADLGTEKLRAWHSMSYVSKKSFLSTYNTPNTLVVVRDPLERLYSCWKQKISDQRDDGFFYFFQYYPVLRPGMEFVEFLEAIARIPPVLHEKHFISMSYFFGETQTLKYKFIHIDELDMFLTQMSGSGSPISRANVTTGANMSYEARKLFDSRLAAMYKFEIEILSNPSLGISNG